MFSQRSESSSQPHAGEHNKKAFTHLHERDAHFDCLHGHTVNSSSSFGTAAWVINFGDNSESVIDQPYPTGDSMSG